jgi:purine catabolism regulator
MEEGVGAAGQGSLTVAELLELPAMERGTVVAGGQGLANAVEAVGVLDLTDLDSIRPNQLLFSSAYPLLGIDLEGLIPSLLAHGSSGLGLALSGYWKEVPARLVAAADELGFPLLLLPEGPFDERVNPVLAVIASRQAERLRRSAELHATMTRAALSEAGEPGAVANLLADVLGHPSAIFDEWGETVATTGEERLWNRDRLAEGVIRAKEPGPIVIGDDTYFVAPIPGANPPVGAVCVYGIGRISSFGWAAVAHATVVAGMLLVGRRQIHATLRRFERELIDDLVERRITRAQDARWRAGAIGWPLRRPYLAVVIGHSGSGADSARRALDLDDGSLTTLRGHLVSLGYEFRLFVIRPGLGIIVHLRTDDDARAVAARLGELLALQAEWFAAGELSIGVAEPKREIGDLPDAFREAALALTLSGLDGQSRPRVTHFSDLGAFRLLARVSPSDRHHLQRAAWSLLRPLDDPGLSRRTELMQTLASLFTQNMNLTATSGTLFYSYNTIRHRLRALHRLLGPSLDQSEGRLTLSLAISALRLLHADRALQARTVELRPLWWGWTVPGRDAD